MIKNDLGYVNEDFLRHWSKSAIECYNCGCVCSKCTVSEIREEKTKCQMKQYVLELVKKFGVPDVKN